MTAAWGFKAYNFDVNERRQHVLMAGSNRLGVGDPVVFAGSSDKIGTGPYRAKIDIASGGDTDQIGGILLLADQLSVATGAVFTQQYYQATSNMYGVIIRPEPRDTFLIWPSTALAATAVGANANLVNSTGTLTLCSTTSGLSAVTLDSASVTHSTSHTTYQCTIIDFPDEYIAQLGAPSTSVLLPVVVQINNIQKFYQGDSV